MLNWAQVKSQAFDLLAKRELPEIYYKRLKFEIQEIEKQGSETYWVNNISANKKFKSNPNNLVLPWLYDLVTGDPLADLEYVNLTTKVSDIKSYIQQFGNAPHDVLKDPDMPDIDIDCLPDARDHIKEFALNRYKLEGDDDTEFGPVCSVGTWQTYKFKSAIIAVSRALNACELYEVHAMTKELPEEVDELKEGGYANCKGLIINSDTQREEECLFYHDQIVCPKCGSPDTDGPTINKILAENEALASFYNKYPKVIDTAKDLVGRVSNMGMHSGAIIISDRNLFGSIPMAKSGSKGFWLSMWTEGRNTQLSKFGYCKYDFLGLKTLEYIFNCCKLVEKNRGISFGENISGLDDIDPELNRAGHYFDGDGNKHYINLNDPHALDLADKQRTDGVFQFDTELAKCVSLDSKILTDNGLIQISALDPRNHKILYASKDGARYTSNYEVKCSGVKKVKRIMLDDGRELKVTAEHRLFTRPRGYIAASELQVGDEIIEIRDFYK